MMLSDDELSYPKKDQDYITARNKLMPQAAAYADGICFRRRMSTKERDNEWSRLFLRQMDRLARERGLVKGGN